MLAGVTGYPLVAEGEGGVEEDSVAGEPGVPQLGLPTDAVALRLLSGTEP